MSGISSRATKGKVTKMVASTMPGRAKMILTACSESQEPNQPCSPKRSTNTRPEITGETAKGRSIKVMSRFLPVNSNFATAQDAARPKTTLAGTAIAATVSVSRIALRVAGAARVDRKAPIPLRNASENTDTSGTSRKAPTKINDIAIARHRTQAGSVNAVDRAPSACGSSLVERLTRSLDGCAAPGDEPG